MFRRLSLIGVVLLAGVFLFNFSLKNVSAQTVGLSGFAWSDLPQSSSVDRGAGWISFSGPGYGVVANSTTGNLSGYAWSEHYGWLSFNSSDVSGCPSGTCQPNIDPYNGSATGWARFIAAPTGTTGIWNGWVHLSGSGYGVTYSTSTLQLSGYAWGDSDIGWVHFSGSGYAVTMNPLTPPTATINVVMSPSSGTWTINPGNFTGTGNGTATVTPSQAGTSYTLTPGAAPSGYDFPPTITNSQSGGSVVFLTGGQSATYTVTYTQTFNYSLSNDGNVTVTKAGVPRSGQNVITATNIAGAGTAVTLSVSGLPSGVSVGFSNQGCSPNPGVPCSYTATFTVQPSATAGTYPITVTGSPLSKTTNFNLTINNSPNMIISCTAVPSTAYVGDEITWTANIINDPNGNSPYTFSWAGDNIPVPPVGPPTTQSINVTYSTKGVKNIQATVWDSLLNQALCPNATINIGASPGYEEF